MTDKPLELKTAVIELATGREIVEHAPLRAGPFVDSTVYDHAADAGCMVLRKFHGISGDGNFVRFLDTKEGEGLLESFRAYMRFELNLEVRQ